MKKEECIYDKCTKPVYAAKFCREHYDFEMTLIRRRKAKTIEYVED